MKKGYIACIIIFSILFSSIQIPAQTAKHDVPFAEIEQRVKHLMKEGDIPGLSLVVIMGESLLFNKGFGFADLEKNLPVTPATSFEIASCSKSFTALAILRLEQEGVVSLDDRVSKYFPWFYVAGHHEITLRQLLYQTSGIPWNSISKIPKGNLANAIEQTVRNLVGIELNHQPGNKFEYATVNYDIIGAIIEKVTGLSYESYMRKQIFEPLKLMNTNVGTSIDASPKATGYKIGFFSPREYDSPVFRGNFPAGYIISNGNDLVTWLRIQLGIIETELMPLIQRTHIRDESVAPDSYNLTSYGMGWEISLKGDGLIYHTGLNPNFTSYIGFIPEKKIGVAVLANSNSNYTNFITEEVIDMLTGVEDKRTFPQGNTIDKACTVIVLMLCFYLLCIFVFYFSMIIDLIKKRRKFEFINLQKAGKLLLALVFMLPLLYAIFLIPKAMSGISWSTALLWSPISFKVAVYSILTALAASFWGYFLSLLFPIKDQNKRSIPFLVLLSIISGGANAAVIFLITGAIFSDIDLFYKLYFFGLAFFMSIIGRKILQTQLVKITLNIVYELRIELIEKIFRTSFQKFEKIDRGRIYATLFDDTQQIGNAANILVQLMTAIITISGAFIFLATIAFWATTVSLIVVIIIAALYYVVSIRAEIYFEQSRNARNIYMGLLNSMIDGFKELSLHFGKKTEFKKDIEESCNTYRKKRSISMIKFVNVFLIGESMLIIVLGAVAFGVPELFPEMSLFTITSFIMVLLYLIGPITNILSAVPTFMDMKVSWNRIQKFIKDIPANVSIDTVETGCKVKTIDNFQARDLKFEYKNLNEHENFSVGPINLEVKKGEIIFIIGGNGSGKTTLAKLLTGLYTPDSGTVRINDNNIKDSQIGEYFSTVFSDYYLFKKLYNIDLSEKKPKIESYLKLLELDKKVSIQNDSFSTLNLSGGQKKRLALLQCFLQDSPIFLFDEIAADQDPEFRKFFYRSLLIKMKEQGKIVIAITHDDHYFAVADKIIKLDRGKIDDSVKPILIP